MMIRLLTRHHNLQNPADQRASLAMMLFALIGIPIIAQIICGPLGFNPTDDGFTLAYSRRILAGQIPHRDFIIIRPFLSPLLHAPIVLWGGQFTYWLSRLFVWFQFAWIAWSWVAIIEQSLKQSLANLPRIAIILIAMAASVHTFPIMAWHTIDGLFLLSSGIMLASTRKPALSIIGYFLIGASYLCKQSFIFAPPLILLLLGDWRRIKYWLAMLLPGIVYVAWLALTGSFFDAFLQLTAQQNIVSAGFLAYLNRELVIGSIIGLIAGKLLSVNDRPLVASRPPSARIILGLLLLVTPVIVLIATYAASRSILRASFYPFGVVTGMLLIGIIQRRPLIDYRLSAILLIAAWSSSLSVGYNYPIFVNGPLLALIVIAAYPSIQNWIGSRSGALVLAALALICLVAFGRVRIDQIYREQPAPHLTYALDDVLPGGTWIRTNPTTYASLADLQIAAAIATNQAKTYTILPDYPGYWVQSSQLNPISIDWPQSTELNRPELRDRVIHDLESIRVTNLVIVQKYEAGLLANGLVPLNNHYQVVEYVRGHFVKIQETQFFEIYQ